MENKKETVLSKHPKIQAFINIILGCVFPFLAYWMWLDLTKWEIEGGTRYSSRLFFFLYDIFGKEVTCILVGACSLIFFYNAYKLLKKRN